MADVIVIGGGIAGLTAAIYTARGGFRTLLLEKNCLGGQIAQAATVENFPGFVQIEGLTLADRMAVQARKNGVEISYETVTQLGETPRVRTDQGEYAAKAVILANGVVRRRLRIPGEERLAGHGVSYCAHCDGQLYRGKTVAVVGGGNTALQEALQLSKLCRQVHLIHRRERLTAQEALQKQAACRENITIHLQTTVTEICGTARVEQLRLRDGLLPVSGIFIAIGYAPDNQWLSHPEILDEEGYVVAREDCTTELPWLFAAGDTRRKTLRQLVTAAADGATAAAQAMRLLNGMA